LRAVLGMDVQEIQIRLAGADITCLVGFDHFYPAACEVNYQYKLDKGYQ